MKSKKFILDTPSKDEYTIMLSLWESSVRATHHFLKEKDIEFLKALIQEHNVFDQVAITVARDSAHNIVGIMGVAEDDLAMLFVHADFIGQGVGGMLTTYAINTLNVKTVEVNEANEQAIKFYEHFGFKVRSRSDLDSMGNPYPLLYMALE